MIEQRNESVVETAHELGQEHPSLLTVGSVGRLAIMGMAVTDIKPSGERRDVDVFRFGERDRQLPSNKNDTRIDSTFEKWVKDDWLVFPYDESLAVRVPHADDVFAPREVAVGDYTIKVPIPQVLAELNTVQYIQRDKDRESMRIYNEFLASREDLHELPEELLEPFTDFRQELAKRKSYTLFAPIRARYRAAVPQQLRQNSRVRRVTGKIRAAIEGL